MPKKISSKRKKGDLTRSKMLLSGKLTAHKSSQITRKSKGSIRSKIRSVGNSRGVILSRTLLQRAGLADDADILVTVNDGQIIIIELKESNKVNTDLSSWERQFKRAIKNGAHPEKDLFEGISNAFDKNEWIE